MTSPTREPPLRDDRSPSIASAGRRVASLLAVAANVVLLYVVGHLVDWEFPPFLTADFDRALPWIEFGLWVNIAVNAARVVVDARWFRLLGDGVTAAAGIPGLIRMWQVFPFEFDGGFPWDTVFRVFLVLGVIGSVIGILAAIGRLGKLLVDPEGAG